MLSPSRYFFAGENILSMLVIATFPLVTLYTAPSTDEVWVMRWQYHMSAVAILLTWTLNMLYISKNPVLGNYIQMLVKVSINFMKFFLAIASLLIAFATSFSILFPREASLNNVASSPFKECLGSQRN